MGGATASLAAPGQSELPSYCTLPSDAHLSAGQRRRALLDYFRHIAPGALLTRFGDQPAFSGTALAHFLCWGSLAPSNNGGWQLADRTPVLAGIDHPGDKDAALDDGSLHADNFLDGGPDRLRRPVWVWFTPYPGAFPAALLLKALGPPNQVKPRWEAWENNMPDNNGMPGATLPYHPPTTHADVLAHRNAHLIYKTCVRHTCAIEDFLMAEKEPTAEIVNISLESDDRK